jgi:4-hydroxybenzoate polyprenyltransferase
MTTAARAGPLVAMGLLAADIKIAHSVFALPFAVLAAFLAGPGPAADPAAWGRFAGQLALVVACMVLARTWAMLVNRLADRAIDARNQRTASRAIASGRVHPGLAWALALAAAGGFVLAADAFRWCFANPWPLYLCLPVLGWLAFYSFTKRFTWLCHVVLGVSLALSPVAAALAVRPAALLTTPSIWWSAGFVVLWVAGFDVIYALQDQATDREQGLRSIPARLGTHGAVWVARAWHVVAIIALLAAWTAQPEWGWLFGVGIGLVVAALAVEHAAVARSLSRTPDRPALHAFYFTLNGIVALTVGILGVVDHLIGG